MKSFQDYLAESQHWMENPAVGDDFAINIKEDCLIESHIIAVEQDRLCIEADSKLIAILESYGYTVEDTCSSCGHEACICKEELDEDPTEEEPMSMTMPADNGTEEDDPLGEAEYQGRKVPLGKPMRGDTKKFKVYVKDPATGNIKKVNFGHGGTTAKRLGQKTMKIKKSNPARRKSFRARHNCDNPGPRTKARYWSCRAW
jgi:hypothetical protein